MSVSAIHLVRGSAKVAVVLVSVVLGLCLAALAVWAAMYFGHGVGTARNPYGDSADSIPLMMYILLFGISGLIGGTLVGIDAAEQLLPCDETRAGPVSARTMRIVRRWVQVGIVVLSVVLGLYLLGSLGLIAGVILGFGAAAQLWPSASDERTS